MKLAIAGIATSLLCFCLVLWVFSINIEEQHRLREQSAAFDRTIQGIVTSKYHDRFFAVQYQYRPPESEGMYTLLNGFAYVDQATYDSVERDGPVTVRYSADNVFSSNIEGNRFDLVIQESHWLFLTFLGVFLVGVLFSAHHLFEVVTGRIKI